MGNESDVIVETKNLTKTYRDFWGRQKVRALKALDLEIRRGEIFGLLGPNGSGKTTTIKLLLGLLFPTSGEVNILGRPASDVAKNERIGYLPEASSVSRNNVSLEIHTELTQNVGSLFHRIFVRF